MIREENLRFWNLKHKETFKKEEKSYEIILNAEFEEEFQKEHIKGDLKKKIWISVYCFSPGDYSYSFDGNDSDINEIEFNQDERKLLDLFLSETNVILEESERLGIELNENDKYHWGLA